MGEIIASLDGYLICSPGHNFDWKHAGVSRVIPQRARILTHEAGIFPARQAQSPLRGASENLQATRLPLHLRLRAVSSVVERLVYTEFRVVSPVPSIPL